MRRRRGTAVAIALLGAALAAAGCGLGPGADVGSVELTVTREFGSVPVLHRSLEAKESDTVMRALEADADVETRFGGGFVHAIDGVAEGEREGDPYDWFFFVDGVESPVGAADVELQGDERVWWDYRDWSATNHVPAVVGSWPAPFTDGVAGKPYPVVLECEGGGSACAAARKALKGQGVELASGSPERAIRMLVGPWNRLRKDAAAQLLEAGPAESGIYANFESSELVALDENGNLDRRFGSGAGLVAATSRYGGPPVWLVTGGTAAGVRAAADALDAAHLRDHYAVAIEGGQATPLPVKAR
ncbi:MAG TPA: DUF4430 domain-containing protein [Solirubrobacterales bacterium]|nr:DUF4430 domain-containing protein [Solirubrobacterales bacterium]